MPSMNNIRVRSIVVLSILALGACSNGLPYVADGGAGGTGTRWELAGTAVVPGTEAAQAALLAAAEVEEARGPSARVVGRRADSERAGAAERVRADSERAGAAAWVRAVPDRGGRWPRDGRHGRRRDVGRRRQRPVCQGKTHPCAGTCADNTSVATCGTLCDPCTPPAGGTATCDGTACDFTCGGATPKKCANGGDLHRRERLLLGHRLPDERRRPERRAATPRRTCATTRARRR